MSFAWLSSDRSRLGRRVGVSCMHATCMLIKNIQIVCLFPTEGKGPMKITSYYPVIMTDDVAGTADFWQSNFRFASRFTSDWYVHLQSDDDEAVNLAILDGNHETIPAGARGKTSGLILNFEVEDVDADYARLKEAGLPILLELRDEA